ncbi:MAG: histidinol-phosphate transaminase [Dehalococcoidia bacterium]|jgi:histidinol-phosphate aminotransferase
MPLAPRKAVASLTPGQHGGPDYAELEKLGIAPEELIDFSVSLNPNGVPSKIRPLVKGTRLASYPDPRCLGLRRAIARRTGLSIGNIIAGNGATELIRLAAIAYLDRGDRALVIEPTYGDYRTAAEITGAEVVAQRLSATSDFKPDILVTIALIKSAGPKLVFIGNPNNPTGAYLSRHQFERILDAVPDSLVVLDEAFVSFVSRGQSFLELIDRGNLLIVRSMTKDYGLAGLRLGYAVAGARIIATLERVRPPWSVNVVAQQAGIAALSQENYLQKGRELAVNGKRYLVEELEKMGYRCLPSRANFFLAEVGDAAGLRKQLLSRGILVRDCGSFGLPRYIRLAPKSMKKNRRLIAALEEMAMGGAKE